MDFDDIFREECLYIREKSITFYKGSGFCHESWIIFQNCLPWTDRALTDILPRIYLRNLNMEVNKLTGNISNTVGNYPRSQVDHDPHPVFWICIRIPIWEFLPPRLVFTECLIV